MASRSPVPSGTPTNRSRGSFGWSTRTLAKVRDIFQSTNSFLYLNRIPWDFGDLCRVA